MTVEEELESARQLLKRDPLTVDIVRLLEIADMLHEDHPGLAAQANHMAGEAVRIAAPDILTRTARPRW